MGKKRTIPIGEHLAKESEELYKAVNAESPLGCALIVGASVEKAALALVGKYFVDGETAKEMLSENGPLGNFAACAKMAYCLGLISKGMFLNVNRIGLIRNIFAHSNTHINFNEPGVMDLCGQLTWPHVDQHVVAGGGEPTPMSEWAKSPRDRFSLVGIFTFNVLVMRAMSTEHRDRFADGWDHPPKD